MQKLEQAVQAVKLEDSPHLKVITDQNDELSSIQYRESGLQSNSQTTLKIVQVEME